ncbi:hypothetical protein BKA93DRAFT_824080 [Sparassis latifolia]
MSDPRLTEILGSSVLVFDHVITFAGEIDDMLHVRRRHRAVDAYVDYKPSKMPITFCDATDMVFDARLEPFSIEWAAFAARRVYAVGGPGQAWLPAAIVFVLGSVPFATNLVLGLGNNYISASCFIAVVPGLGPSYVRRFDQIAPVSSSRTSLSNLRQANEMENHCVTTDLSCRPTPARSSQFASWIVGNMGASHRSVSVLPPKSTTCTGRTSQEMTRITQMLKGGGGSEEAATGDIELVEHDVSSEPHGMDIIAARQTDGEAIYAYKAVGGFLLSPLVILDARTSFSRAVEPPPAFVFDECIEFCIRGCAAAPKEM